MDPEYADVSNLRTARTRSHTALYHILSTIYLLLST